MLRYVSPLAAVAHSEVILNSRSDVALAFILGSRFGLVTASNDQRGFGADRVPASVSEKFRGLWSIVVFLVLCFFFL